MYSDVVALARKYGLSIVENRKSSEIAGYICLDNGGNYEYFEGIDKKNRKVKLIPDFGSYSRVPRQPNPICEKAMYILNWHVGKNNGTKKYPYWVETMKSGNAVCESLSCVWRFIEKFDEDEIFANEVSESVKNAGIKPTDVLSFRIDGVPIEDMIDWNEWVNQKVLDFKEKNNKGKNADKAITESDDIDSYKVYSIISGELQDPFPKKSGPEIKNVPKDIKAAFFGGGAVVYVACMKERSYESYGMDGATGTQMGLQDAKDFAAGMEYLLSNVHKIDEKGNNIYANANKQFRVVFWYEDDVPNIFMGSLIAKDKKIVGNENNENDDENEDEEDDVLEASGIADILRCVYEGIRPNMSQKNAKYHMAKFVANQGRYHFENEHSGYYNDIVMNLYKFYDDTKIVSGYRNGVPILYIIQNVYNVLLNCVHRLASEGNKDVFKSVKDELGQLEMPLLDTMYFGKQLPERLYRIAVEKVIHGVVTYSADKGDGKKSGGIRRVWMSMIKLYLLRKGVNVMPECSVNVSQAYACGKLFAVYCKLQRDYNRQKKLNKTLSQTYFSAIVKQPALIFAKLSPLSIVYLNGLRKDAKKEKSAVFYEKLLGSLSEEIGTEFPKQFNASEQGEFVLGYYQQLNALYKKNEKTESDGQLSDNVDDNNITNETDVSEINVKEEN